MYMSTMVSTVAKGGGMGSEAWIGADPVALDAAQSAVEFRRCRKRLERRIDRACDPDQPWPARASAGIHAALDFARTDPTAAWVLTVHATVRRLDGGATFGEMVDRLAGIFSRGAPEPRQPPPLSPENVVIRIARQAHRQIEAGETVVDISADLIFFALTPYVGYAEAKRWSERGAGPGLAGTLSSA
jgi:hypothetical protein